MTLTVAFVDDDADLRHATAQGLSLAGLEVALFDSAAPALAAVEQGLDGIVVTDVRMAGMDGLALFERLQAFDDALPVILISGHADVTTAVEAVQRGAYDFLTKPYAPERLILTIRRALEKRRLVLDNRRLRVVASETDGDGPLLGISHAMVQLRRTVAQVASSDVDVLIEGETGTGKSLLATAVHAASTRRRRAMVTIDCGALPDSHVDSELFGHVSGAFAGAVHPRRGRLEQADGGTLFLDEFHSARGDVQAKLNRVFEAREIVPLGGNQGRSIDIRVIVASKLDLGAEARAGRFHASLYHRLAGVTLRLPPLRERREDIPLLFRHFLQGAAKRLHRPLPQLDADGWRRLERHDWPGNARELQRFAEQVAIVGVASTAGALHAAPEEALRLQVARFEAEAICRALAATQGHVGRAIERLGLPRKTFYDKIARHGIDVDRFR